ncbi:hypothetical protein [uncultured Thiothrix sp.]|uniref:hypothetical protein n=1 Tax=uncultured Thiothrix sp. TaxID=223185 RepID=UPI00262D8D7D|nr:hypothetical protein [uncultured Thiothrix sp.]HMT93296.1 hypothetical protein [Thiolinea sp.]
MNITMNAVFIKTPKGREEVDSKAGGLSLIMRRVLIFLDGKRTLREVKTLPKIDDVEQIITSLEKQGYIQLVSGETETATESAVNSKNINPLLVNRLDRNAVPAFIPPARNGHFRPLPARVDVAQLKMAKNFMANTLNAFVGTFGSSALINRIERCEDHESLRAIYDDWLNAIMGTKQGRKDVDNLKAKLLEVL